MRTEDGGSVWPADLSVKQHPSNHWADNVNTSCRYRTQYVLSGKYQWSVKANAWWPALADCSSEAAVQARCDGPSLSSTPGSKISRRLCQNAEFLGRQHLWSASRRQLSVPRVRPQHVWKPSYFSRLTNSPEFTARLFTRSSCFRRDLKMHLFTGAWGVFYVIVRYRLTFTYFLFYPQYFDYSGIP